MSTKIKRSTLRRMLGGIFAAGIVCQVGSCDLGQITTTVTVDGLELISGAIRTAILTPIDAAITEALNELLGANQ